MLLHDNFLDLLGSFLTNRKKLFFVFMSFEKLYLAEMKIYFEQSIANLFVNNLFEIKIQYTSVDNFSKGFLLFFSISDNH